MRKNFSWATIYIVLIFILMYLPIAYLIFYSFNAGGDMSGFTEFTLEHYQTLFSDKRLLSYIANTFIVALSSALIATIIGTFGALAIFFSRRSKSSQVTMQFNNVLMVTPDVMMGASFLILFSTVIPVTLGFWSVLIAHVAFSIPIVVLMVLPKSYEMNLNMITAAQDLGATQWQTLTRVILPSILKGIVAGFFMAFTYSLDDFAVTFFVTGAGFSTVSIEVYSRARTGISLEINALSTLMFILALLLVFGYYRIQISEQQKRIRPSRRIPFQGGR
ncbi:spermidine/putrescine ABC transporter permease PotC [Falseniella ignava]|uniref:Spermidine/putrescine ABC transporter permease PotC n=2 Tax=Falseniella ignava TaxID=137730 RepID=A0A2I1K5A0_9LACT|nr:spermidine/putrescine ABC transporter permease PotC [Falseniella ignava]